MTWRDATFAVWALLGLATAVLAVLALWPGAGAGTGTGGEAGTAAGAEAGTAAGAEAGTAAGARTRAGVARRPLAPLQGYLEAHPAARVVLVVGWMWVGWHFFAR